MRVKRWARYSWWEKTRTTAVIFCSFAAGVVFLLMVLLAGLGQTPNASNMLSWIALSIFPIVIVVLLATLVRVQSRINMRSGGSQHTTRPSVSQYRGLSQ